MLFVDRSYAAQKKIHETHELHEVELEELPAPVDIVRLHCPLISSGTETPTQFSLEEKHEKGHLCDLPHCTARGVCDRLYSSQENQGVFDGIRRGPGCVYRC